MTCGKVPIPTVNEDEAISFRFYNEGDTRSFKVYKVKVEDYTCIPLTFCENNDGLAALVYGVYGEGRHYLDVKSNRPYSLDNSSGSTVGSVTMLETRNYASYPNHWYDASFLDISGNDMTVLDPYKTYKLWWNEGSQYEEASLPSDCVYLMCDDAYSELEAEFTKNGYYEYSLPEGAGDGMYMIEYARFRGFFWVRDGRDEADWLKQFNKYYAN